LQADPASAHDETSARAYITSARQCATVAPLIDSSRKALGKGLSGVYKRGRRALSIAQETATTESLHEWRKHVKTYWHALEVFEPLRPKRIGAAIADIRRLAQLLGDDHDIALLDEKIRAGGAADDAAVVGQLLDTIAAQRERLQRKSFALGAEVYALRPKALAGWLLRHLPTDRAAGKVAPGQRPGNAAHAKGDPRPPLTRERVCSPGG
jgi:hypothetical protein